MLITLLWLKKLNRVIRLLNLKLVLESGLQTYASISSKGYNKNWLKEIFIIDSVTKINSWTHKIIDLIGGKKIGRFHEKELLLSTL